MFLEETKAWRTLSALHVACLNLIIFHPPTVWLMMLKTNLESCVLSPHLTDLVCITGVLAQLVLHPPLLPETISPGLGPYSVGEGL